MPILYSVVARGTIILAKHAACVGNFEEVTAKILAKIPPDNDKLTYSQGPYLFHYICEDRLIYMCITDDDFQRSRAFLYLNEIKRRFLAVYGPGAQTAVAYAMNTEFARVLANEMKHYSESKDLDRLSQVHGELDELKDIMVKNIDNIAMRGERLELLVNKTENLSANENEQKSGALPVLEKRQNLRDRRRYLDFDDIRDRVDFLRRYGMAKLRRKIKRNCIHDEECNCHAIFESTVEYAKKARKTSMRLTKIERSEGEPHWK
ncbi:vesicle-associated membrane protein 7 isoform X1 [Ooceraea biroi]|uniref:Vesicle-associated membrane protein 7 n=1 Tax=Ooceraea biroi TaxID=2015173 RepID=A0A026W6E0_OOCBI|nr:vesicle-associated membrane protein 7 isoform X1 [Ooceraea biroi]XP_011344728.1 vesicle-associated membrane protein 7 isoform X1 [Ooceraea biroi]XP_011344729.1 vesicle-associated membrane protein 7 isoform X1 [Ooceraea biroi]XP_011344730.1 vesicle-associated membrane protein 7 isoform X1 [Ooceraea biroi]EZA50594.1 Vesicle-associated membrane protein [Ooceraea biroi]